MTDTMLGHRIRALLVVLCLGMLSAAVQAHASPDRNRTGPPSSVYAIGRGDIPGWTVTHVYASRYESDWRAWKDSQPNRRYFYRGSWQPLGRTGGWFESLTVSDGAVEGQVVVLVSTFSTGVGARTSYPAIVPKPITLPPNAVTQLPIGDQSAEWQTDGGVASGARGLAGHMAGYTSYLQEGRIVAEIRADVWASGRAQPSDPGRAVARYLSKVA